MGNDISGPIGSTTASKSANKKIAIKCEKGKTVKKVLAIKPVCPNGFKQVPA
jgi:hypothetical protein